MKARHVALLGLSIALAACGGGPAVLGYGLPAETSVTYAFGDTTTVNVNAMGQNMQIAMRGDAEYGVTFARAGDGVAVTLTVQRLAATVDVPMGAPMRVTESAVDGTLAFTLDQRGRATVTSTPEVEPAASQMISGLTMAHTFFPRLPGRVVVAGDRWTDTISYQEEGELATDEDTVLDYVVTGDTVVDGRALTRIDFTGTSTLSNSMNMGGMPVSQTSTVDVRGYTLWDAQVGIMYEMASSGRGRGTVRVPIAPMPLPIEITSRQRTRLVH